MPTCLPGKSQPRLNGAGIPEFAFCAQKARLLDEFLEAIHELTSIQSMQTQAVIDGDADFARFDLLLHLAQERKDEAKYAWIAHVEAHHCEGG